MTRRERLERKLELREEWAEKAEARSDALSEQSHRMMSAIPMGQPILVGHHSEKRDRRYRDRAWNKMGRAVEQRDLAKHHESKAAGLAHHLDRSIFSDDANAVEAIEERIKGHENQREHMKTINRLYRKGDAPGLATHGLNLDALREKLNAPNVMPWCRIPYPAYELQNLGQRITSDRKRVEEIKRRQAKTAEAEAAPNGVVLKQSGEWCTVTFAEKPSREILNSLRAAGFHWGGGSWSGKHEALPGEVKTLLLTDSHTEQAE